MSVLGIRRTSVTATACVAGIASAAACGCGIDLIKALASCAFALFAQTLLERHLAARATSRLAWGLYFGIGFVLGVHSGGGLVLIGLFGAGVIWVAGLTPSARPALRAVLLGAGGWLLMVGVNYVQRGSFFIIPLVSAVSFACMVAAAEWTEAVLMPGTGALPVTKPNRLQARWAVAALTLAAHAWLVLAVWWLIPPVASLAALAALPIGLIVAWRLGRPGANAKPAAENTAILAAFAALVHGVGLAVGSGWVVWMR